MSEKYQQFKAVLAELKSKASAQDGIYVPESENPLLNTKGVILVSQKDVKRLDLASQELSQASERIKAACSAMHGFEAISLSEAQKAQSIADLYNRTIQEVVRKAYQRRREAAQGVAA